MDRVLFYVSVVIPSLHGTACRSLFASLNRESQKRHAQCNPLLIPFVLGMDCLFSTQVLF